VRRLVSSGLTPRMISRVEEDLRARTRRLFDEIAPSTAVDFVTEIAAEVPMQMICILLGVPESERHWLFEAIEPSFDFGGSRKAAITRLSVEEAGSRMFAYGQELIAAKKTAPSDDMLSVVVNSGDPELSDIESYLFFNLLFSAGAETTRNSIAGGLLALAENPDSYRALREDPASLPTAIEEMVRWTSPSPSKRRTVTQRADLGGHPVEPGQKVLVWEGSANRDAAVFVEPDRFDIARKPNPHLGFGQGVHYCLGANLARLELRVIFDELLRRYTSVELAQPVEWTRSNRHTGIRHLVVQLDPSA
jgi:cytochrome P450